MIVATVMTYSSMGFAQAKCKLKYGSETLTGQACEKKLQSHCKSRGVSTRQGTVRGEACIKYYRGYMAAEDECKAIDKAVVQKLGYASLPDHQRQNKLWLEKATLYGKLATDTNLKKIDQCKEYGYVKSNAFRRNRAQLQKTWAEVVADASKDSLTFQTLLKAAKQRNNPIAVLQAVQSELDRVALIKQNNALPLFKADTKALEKRQAALSGMKQEALTDIQKSLKKTKCPRDKNKRLSKKLSKLVKTHFDSGTHPKDVKRFVVTGKASKKRIAYKRITHEDVPGFACYRIKHESKLDYDRCGMYSISVRRTKIDGQKWSPFQNVLVGPIKYMSCKNLK